jgi:5-oxoprolinase (ATP-hydrolysing)
MFHRGRQDDTNVPSVPRSADPAGDRHSDEIWFYVAARGHHAEIGGISPGSMPSASTRVEEEGVLIDNWLLVENGRLNEAETIDLLETAMYPSRAPATNLADLRAQIAANEEGIRELHAMVDHFGLDVVRAYMGHVQENAAESVRRVITALHDGHYEYELDNGAKVKVAVRVNQQGRTAEIDFTGTSGQLKDNFNAPSSVAMAAVLYVFRTLVDDDIPLNSGCLQPLTVIIPEHTMLSPQYPAAVAAGNVETSQIVTGALYAALGVMAEGSGTMNNVTFGNDRYQYYETVASGSGAGDGFDGTDVVQTKMTNSRLTDPEVLEWRYPVLLESYRIRPGSGGAGRWHGGNGGIRRLRFNEPMTVTTLTGHRRVPAFGMAGGQPGALGRHWIEHPDGTVTPMQGCDSVPVRPGDVFVIETPGGGGYGSSFLCRTEHPACPRPANPRPKPGASPDRHTTRPASRYGPSASSSRSTATSAASSPLVWSSTAISACSTRCRSWPASSSRWAASQSSGGSPRQSRSASTRCRSMCRPTPPGAGVAWSAASRARRSRGSAGSRLLRSVPECQPSSTGNANARRGRASRSPSGSSRRTST